MKLTIFLEKDVQKKISLKELLSSHSSHNISNDLDLRISIAPNISIDIIDDLIDISKTPEQMFKNKLEFVLHENSILNYVMRSIENHTQKTSEQVLQIQTEK